MALGMALAEKINGYDYRTYSLLSDGECNEGSIWEAAMLSASQKVNKLTAIVDYNKWQATGRSNEVLSLENLAEKWISFGWDVDENGMFVQAKGKLELTDKEFKQFISNISKVMKRSEGNIRTDKYDLDKFSFVNDTVFLWVNAKIGSFSKQDLKQLKKL